MKLIAAFVVVLACAYFQTTSATCTDGVSIMVNGATGQDQSVMRPLLLLTFGSGEQRYLGEPMSRYSKTIVRIGDKGGKLAISALDKVAYLVFRPRLICEIDMVLDQAKGDFTHVECGQGDDLIHVTYRCL